MNWTQVPRGNQRIRVLVLLCCISGVYLLFYYNNMVEVKLYLNSVSGIGIRSTPDDEMIRTEGVLKLFQKVNSTPVNVLVLIWTTFFGYSELSWFEINNDSYPDCFRHCEVTDNKSKLDGADAIIFNAEDLIREDFPKQRENGQFWVITDNEAPIAGTGLGLYPGVFNWTMTYRMDSDVFRPYGEIEEIPDSMKDETKVRIEIDLIVSGKTKLVAGVISHCKTLSKRETLISQLQTHIPVDIYGKCGIHICERLTKHCNHSAFWKDISLQYKFYLAFENSLCVDYVTEKLFRTLELGMVPVVYGEVIYTDVAPPHSFIDVSDFKSPWELANFLTKLDKNETEYRKYFEWKLKYRVKKPTGFCNLCKKLQRIGLERLTGTLPALKAYHDLETWRLNYPPPRESLPSENKIGKSNTTLSPVCKPARY